MAVICLKEVRGPAASWASIAANFRWMLSILQQTIDSRHRTQGIISG
jgi:hypothetical protein